MKNIIIIGSGETTRANVEALLDDYVYAHKDLSVSILVNGTKPSEGQVWAAQYAADQEREVIIYHDNAYTAGPFFAMGLASVFTENFFEELKPDATTEAFFLWNDDDPVCLNALSRLSTKNIPCKDLTNGLCEIKANADIQEIEAPVIPVQEQVAEETPIVVEDSFNNYSFTDLDDDEEEYEDALYEGIRIIADIFADAFVQRLKRKD
jgi:hypothetical protein